jgi:hypothetical protein
MKRSKTVESESESDLSDKDEPMAMGKPVTKKKKYEQKFLNSWLSEPQFKCWLERRKDVPHCKICDCSLSCAKTALKRHMENKKHKDLSKIKEQVNRPITSTMFGPRANPARIEIKLCSFITEKNLPISIVEDLVPLLRNLFPSDPALREVKLGKQKATNVIRQVLGFHAIKKCVSKLRNEKFSVIIDETTDKSTTSQLAILAVYFNEKTFKLEIALVDLVPLSNGAAATIYKALLKNVIGFCADTCNVMFGANHSVAQMLVKDHPWIIPIKCSSHLIHLCSSHASKVFPKNVEDLCRNIFSHFSMSSKRCEAFKEFQQFFDLDELKILRPGK